ncbi:amidohydrolase family protein [Mycolicibacterium komossense]|uniref:Amidohydrolase family protein n=1 Tax=Mycolicibacterium komossense TaxID=1779 RepID=A0ABT3C895_9MYCO|nr:amidohydrolase family protein [Mycolicibacterium komossense]MCV7225677.1 amidohydrolase family protein [Mycolicibacterium komossense]
MIIRGATLIDGTTVDIRADKMIVALAERLDALPGDDVLDAHGGLVIPGLHDHHVHIRAAAAAAGSVRLGPPQVRSRIELIAALAAAEIGADGWIRAVGYHDSVAGPLDRHTLDALSPPVPVRVQHRSGVLWTLNTAGLAAIGQSDHHDGRLRSSDPEWAGDLPRRAGGLAELGSRLASYGVTGITDATPDLAGTDAELLSAALPQHVHRLSPGKRILHDDLLDLDGLTDWVRSSHDRGTAVALHCVTVSQLVVAMAALRVAGVHRGDRIEHAALVPPDCLTELAELGVTVVTQPNFVAERGDEYLADVPAEDHGLLWRVQTLVNAGVRVALSTDMPFGLGDPWGAMRAAVDRRTGTGEVLGPDECVPPRTALEMFLGAADDPSKPRTLAPGQPADLCVLAAPPDAVLAELDARLVRTTMVGGRPIYGS